MLTEALWRWDDRTGQKRERFGLKKASTQGFKISRYFILPIHSWQTYFSYPFDLGHMWTYMSISVILHWSNLYGTKNDWFHLYVNTLINWFWIKYTNFSKASDFVSTSLELSLNFYKRKSSSRFRWNQIRWCTFVSKASFYILY